MASIHLKKQVPWLLLSVFLGVVFALAPEVHASLLPLPEATDLNIPKPVGETGVQKFENLLGPIGRVARIILGAIAVLLIVIAGFTMTLTGDNEENVNKQKQAITYAVIGLMMISIAGPLAEVFDFRQGNLFADPDSITERVRLFDDTTRVIVTFLKYLLGALATMMFVYNGALMIVGSGSEENITKAKRNIAVAGAGLLLVIFSDLFVRRILYDAKYNETTSETVIQINQNEFLAQLIAAINIIVGFVGPIFVLGIVIGGVLYITAAGDEERTGLAKKIIVNSTIGVAIIYGAFALVSTVIAGSFQ